MPRTPAKWYVYRNLTKGGYSVKRFGKVLYVTDDIWLMGVDFQVSQAGNARVRESGHRNVHAYCTTSWCPGIWDASALAEFMPDTPARVTYYPKLDTQFQWVREFDSGSIYRAALVHLSEKGCMAYGITGTGTY